MNFYYRRQLAVVGLAHKHEAEKILAKQIFKLTSKAKSKYAFARTQKA